MGFRLGLLLCFLLAFQSLAAEPPKSDKKKRDEALAPPAVEEVKLNYPELEVTPRASDRLEMEARREKQKRWFTHLPIQASAIATLYAAGQVHPAATLSTTDTDGYNTFNSNKKIATGVGATWLIFTGVLAAVYRPYFNGYAEVTKMPKGSTREDLTRERIAEESLYTPAGYAQKLKWFSFISNFAVNLMLIHNSDSNSKLPIAIGAAAAFAPLIFDYRWTEVAEQHRDYKKKIYGPVAGATLLPISPTQYQPGVGLYWVF